MQQAKTNPAAAATANRVLNFSRFPNDNTAEVNETASESLAVRLIARRHGITIARARTVCLLAGIGGEA